MTFLGSLTLRETMPLKHEDHHLHLSLFAVVMAPQDHLAVFSSSRHHGTVLQNTKRENSTLMGPRHLMADAVTACQSEHRKSEHTQEEEEKTLDNPT